MSRLTVRQIDAANVATPQTGLLTLFVDSDGLLKYKDDMAHLTIVGEGAWMFPTAAFVDPIGGTAAGVVGDGNKPFQTIAQAQAASNLVILLPGVYSGTQTLANGVFYYCMPGVRFPSGSRVSDGGVVMDVKIRGHAVFEPLSYGFEFTAASIVDAEIDGMNDVRTIAFMGAGGFLRLKGRRITSNGNNGAAISCNVRGGATMELEAESCYVNHWLVATRDAGNTFRMRCPDVKILDGGPFGTGIAKSLVNIQGTATSNNTIDIDFMGGTYVNENSVQASSFGVRDSALLLMVNCGAGNNNTIKFSNGFVDANNQLGLLLEFVLLDGSVELDNIKLRSLSKPIEMWQRSTAAAGYCEAIFKNCDFEGNEIDLGNGRIARFINCNIKNVDGSGVSNFTFNTSNPTSQGQVQMINCNVQLDAGGGEMFTGFSTALIGCAKTIGTEVLGTGATESWTGSGYTQVPLELPNIRL